jgi:hypothetical protein
MNDESTETSETNQEYVDLRDVVPELSENLVHDDVFYSGGGPRLVVDVRGMLRAVKEEGRILWVNPDRGEFRTAPFELSRVEKAGKLVEAGWRPARFIAVERVEEDDEDPDIVVDLTIEVYSRLETYRVEDASGLFDPEDDGDDGDDAVDEVADGSIIEGVEKNSLIDVARFKEALAVPEGLSGEDADTYCAEAEEKVETQLVRELESLDHRELWDFYEMFVRASHEVMKKKLWGRIKKTAEAAERNDV